MRLYSKKERFIHLEPSAGGPVWVGLCRTLLPRTRCPRGVDRGSTRGGGSICIHVICKKLEIVLLWLISRFGMVENQNEQSYATITPHRD